MKCSKRVALLLSIVFFAVTVFSSNTVAFAAEQGLPNNAVAYVDESMEDSGYYILTDYDENGNVTNTQYFHTMPNQRYLAMPRGTYFHDVTASLTIEDGQASFEGTVSTPYQPVLFKVELQRKKSGSWISEGSVSETYTEPGVYLLWDSLYIIRGTYRTKTTGTALRDNGTPIQSISAYSGERVY